jgi:hypothetical protein
VHTTAKRACHYFVRAIIWHRCTIYHKSLYIVSSRRAVIQKSGHAAHIKNRVQITITEFYLVPLTRDEARRIAVNREVSLTRMGHEQVVIILRNM